MHRRMVIPKKHAEGPKFGLVDIKVMQKNRYLSSILRGCIGGTFGGTLGVHLRMYLGGV